MRACQQQNVDARALGGKGGARRRRNHPLRVKHGGTCPKGRPLQAGAKAPAQPLRRPAVRAVSCDGACWKPSAEVASSSHGPSTDTGTMETCCSRRTLLPGWKATLKMSCLLLPSLATAETPVKPSLYRMKASSSEKLGKEPSMRTRSTPATA